MNFSVRRGNVVNGVVRLVVSGQVDQATCSLLTATIRDAISNGHANALVIDLSGVIELDAYGINALEQGQTLATRHHMSYVVVNTPGLAARALIVRQTSNDVEV